MTPNEGKRAELVNVKIEDSDAELSPEYGMENTSVRISLGDTAIGPGEEGIIITESWTDIPAGEERFSLVEKEEGKLYQLAFCYPHVECSRDGKWIVDPPTFEVGHSWFYDCMGNVEYREGWIDEGFVSFVSSDDILTMHCLSYEVLKKYSDNTPDVKEYTAARDSVMKMNKDIIKHYDNYYINEPIDVYDSEGGLGEKEYIYAPLFLRQARAIMGDEEFFACLKDVYKTYSWKTADTKGIIEIFRAHDSSDKLSELISFYFTGV